MAAWIQNIKRIAKAIGRTNISVYAANAAFFLLLSIFPAAIFLLSLSQYTILPLESLPEMISPIIPSVLQPLITYVLDDIAVNNTISILSISAVTVLWSASRGVYGLVKGLNSVNHLRENRPYLRLRLLCFFYTLGIFAALLGTVALYSISYNLLQILLPPESPAGQIVLFLLRFRSLICIIALTCLFCAIFRYLPCRRSPLKHTLPGSFAAAVGWILLARVFSYYTGTISNYSAIYGSITIVALTMLWLYICMLILFYGGMFNHYLFFHRHQLSRLFGK